MNADEDGAVLQALHELRHRHKSGLTAKKARELLAKTRGFKVSEKRVRQVSAGVSGVSATIDCGTN